jgi:DNA-binding IscR family transcriptional regulator
MHGGYMLVKRPDQVQISHIINVIEEEKPTIAECYADGGEDCSIFDACTIRKPLGKVQQNLNLLLEKTTLEQII